MVVPDDGESRLIQYAELVLSENRQTQLISRRDEPFVIRRHLLESLAPLTAVEMAHFQRVMDLGSGAGLPGIPLAVVCPSVHFVLMDSKRKRILFLRKVQKTLGLENIRIVLGRAEDRPVPLEVDAVIARAVAPLSDLWGWSLPYLNPGGCLLAMKGGDVRAEVQALQEQFESVVVDIRAYSKQLVPETANRFLVVVHKRV